MLVLRYRLTCWIFKQVLTSKNSGNEDMYDIIIIIYYYYLLFKHVYAR